MKKFIIKQTGKKGSGGAYTTLKNPNKELRKEIAEFSPELNYIETGWGQITKWIIESIEGKDVKCTSGRDVKYFTLKELEEFRVEELEKLRNKKYPAYKYFKECYGIISLFDDSDEYAHLRKLDLQNGMSLGGLVGMNTEINTMSVEGYDTFLEYDISVYNGLGFKYRKTGQMLNLHFDKNGDFINRDYNESLHEYTHEDISEEKIVDNFRRKLLKLPEEFEYFRGKYYTDKCCYIPYYTEGRGSYDNEIRIDFAKVKHNGTYQVSSGCSIYKKPKSTVKKTKEDLLNDVRELFKEHFKLTL